MYLCVKGIDFITRSLVLCVRFVDRCLSLRVFSFGHCFVCSIYGIFKLFLVCFHYIDFVTAPTVWYIFCFSFYFNVFVVVCVCVCLALRNNDETLCICCILDKLYICVLPIVVCQF